MNLDPGVLRLPYYPDVDVRQYISLNELMKTYSLGPNSALIMASDLIASEIESIKKVVEDLNSDYVIIDTPGQIEIFAFRESGRYIANELSSDPKVIIYLFDAPFSVNPLNYISNMFLATAIQNRFFLPQLYVLSKVDLLSNNEVEEVLNWGNRIETLENAIEKELLGTNRLMSRDVLHLISRLGISFSLIPVSSKKGMGFTHLHALLTRIFMGGEEAI